MGQKFYVAHFGTSMWLVEAGSLADARTEAIEAISSAAPHLVPPSADEVSVRLVRDGELASLVG